MIDGQRLAIRWGPITDGTSTALFGLHGRKLLMVDTEVPVKVIVFDALFATARKSRPAVLIQMELIWIFRLFASATVNLPLARGNASIT